MAMITVSRASISRSLPNFFPNRLSSSSNRNSAPKKNKLLCYADSSHTKTIRSEVSFCIGTHMIPHPKKVERGGEDSFFVSDYNGGVIAVADGVSGYETLHNWAERNIDPSLFPQELMANASCLVGDEEVSYDPQILIRKAHAATSAVGSATVIVAMLEANGKLKIANVGDCGLRVIRGDQVIFSTSPQEHYFDCPYQLSSEMAGQTYLDAVVCGLYSIISFLSSELVVYHILEKVSRVEVMEGDTIVMGSDGLFDNVFDHEIVSIVAGHSDVTEAAKALANLASIHSMNSEFESPYSLEARSKGFDVPFWKKILGMKLTGKTYKDGFIFLNARSDQVLCLAGGKLDDITVIVGQVVKSQHISLLAEDQTVEAHTEQETKLES
ncbi:hypothetical protein SADUNF_Sadunf16G0166600 [Salix dunnii]|uniref:Protein phosphatase n=1 Tax=Salix dunnii TaxID=1413687 RepID=A0A835J974_9ROSI|nr:hypothetical protein SADUNF_Sadunf16G0166600 [Salix dunnii]